MVELNGLINFHYRIWRDYDNVSERQKIHV
jgi:hypothetical protein